MYGLGRPPGFPLASGVKVSYGLKKPWPYFLDYPWLAYVFAVYIIRLRPQWIVCTDINRVVVALLAAFVPGVQLAVWEHLALPHSITIGRGKLARRLAMALASRIVTLTERDTELYAKLFKPSGTVTTIPNIVLSPGSNGAIRRNEILAMGRLWNVKGFDLLLAAWSVASPKLPNWSLRIVGDGQLREQLVRLAGDLGIEHRVTFAPFSDDPYSMYSECGIFVLSSRFEGLPFVLIEAMTCGAPCISFDCPNGPREVIRNGVNGLLVPAESVDALASAIVKLGESPMLRHRIGNAARSVSKKYTEPLVAARWHEVFYGHMSIARKSVVSVAHERAARNYSIAEGPSTHCPEAKREFSGKGSGNFVVGAAQMERTTVKKHLLVLTPRFPYPEIAGDRIRILNICRALSAHFELTLLSLCATREEMRMQPQDGLFTIIERIYLPRWRSYLNTALALPSSRPLQLAYYESAEFRTKVKSLLPLHDLALAHLIRTGQYLEDEPGVRILEMTDAVSMNYLHMRELSGSYNWKRLVYLLEQDRLKTYELRAGQKFDRVLLTSQADRRFLDPSHIWPIDVIPNGTNLEKMPFCPPAFDANVIVFIGNMAGLQNQDACHYFIQNILTRVKAQANVVFRIVGSASEDVKRQFRRYTGVQMTGRIERIQDGVQGAFCGVCPVRAGAGIQNKILEYLALGLPCVTSTVGLSGVGALPGKELLVYHDPDEAARQILMLYSEPTLRLKLASAGRKLVSRKYDWQNIYREFNDSCLKVLEGKHKGPVPAHLDFQNAAAGGHRSNSQSAKAV
jgi:glycosyltransferase involved in cell wall biosynthesis